MTVQEAFNCVHGGAPVLPEGSYLPIDEATVGMSEEHLADLVAECAALTPTEVIQWAAGDLADEDLEAPLFKALVNRWD